MRTFEVIADLYIRAETEQDAVAMAELFLKASRGTSDRGQILRAELPPRGYIQTEDTVIDLGEQFEFEDERGQ